MTPSILCLSIMPLVGSNPPPTPVSQLVKSHIVNELKKSNHELLVNFDTKTCSNIIFYQEELSSMTLSGETPIWSGEKSVSYTDAIAGRELFFEEHLNDNVQNLSDLSSTRDNNSFKKNWKKWALWTGAAVIAGYATYKIIDSRGSSGSSDAGNSSVALQKGIRF